MNETNDRDQMGFRVINNVRSRELRPRTIAQSPRVAGRALCPVGLLILLGSVMPVLAQGPGGGSLPTLEIENVTVIGKRTVVLPKARKGEVLDTSVYRLPAGDSLLFAERISNLGGPGGALPGYREFEQPLRVAAEASLGTYISPRVLISGEYVRPAYDLGAGVDFRNTAGHVDSAKATSVLLGAHGSLLLGDEGSPIGRFRLSAGVDYSSDSYSLYGRAAGAVDRSRTASTIALTMRDEASGSIHYSLGLNISQTSVADTRSDTTAEASATVPLFNLSAGTRVDSALELRAGFVFASTSLRYGVATQTPSYLSAMAEVEYRANERTVLTGGIVAAQGENSDSGSAGLVMPRLSARYSLAPTLALYAWFAPELRGPSYREQVMLAPYVEREITLHPERIPVNVAFGTAATIGTVALDARLFYQTIENLPAVVATAPGTLVVEHVDASIVGLAATATVQLAEDLELQCEGIFRSSRVADSSVDVPMTPAVDLRVRAGYRFNDRIDIFGTLAAQTEQRTVLATTSLPVDAQRVGPRLLIGGGASYRLFDRLKAFIELDNAIGYSYQRWQNYSAPGFELRGGVRVAL